MKRRTSRGKRWKGLVWLAVAGVGSLAAAGQQTSQLPSAPSAASSAHEPAVESPRSSDPVLAECLRLIDQRRYSDAEGKIRAYLRDHPGIAAAHFLLGYTLYRENKPRESLAEYTSGARLQTPGAGDLAAVAMDYILLRDYADADKWLTQATAWSPGNELYWYYLGRTKYVENRFQEAIAAFNKCLVLKPQDLRAEYNIGLAYAGLNRDGEAIAAYRTAIAWEQGSAVQDPQPWLDLGILLLQESHPDQAVEPLRKAASLDPQNARAHEELGQAWLQLRDLPKADAEMQAAVALAPDIPSLHFEMGRIFQREGLTAKAKQEFDRCAALNATHSTDSAETPNPPPRE